MDVVYNVHMPYQALHRYSIDQANIDWCESESSGADTKLANILAKIIIGL